MTRSVWRIVRDRDDFEDAFQEALATVWKKLDHIRRHPNPHALILRICVNASYDVLRKKSRQRRREELDAVPVDFPDQAPSAADLLHSSEEQAQIYQAIGQLPRNQAEAVLMRFAQELPYSDIAQALGCSEVAARKHVERARTRLVKLLAHLAPFPAQEAVR